jgi:hypothetical protein
LSQHELQIEITIRWSSEKQGGLEMHMMMTQLNVDVESQSRPWHQVRMKRQPMMTATATQLGFAHRIDHLGNEGIGDESSYSYCIAHSVFAEDSTIGFNKV